MQSTWAKLGIPAAALAVVVVLFIVLSGGGDDDGADPAAETAAATSAEAPVASEESAPAADTQDAEAEEKTDRNKEREKKPEDPTIVVRDGEPADGVAELEYGKGDQVRFKVRSDVAEEVHVHGYDISKEVEAGGSVGFDFPAEIDGVFEVELEGSQTQLAELRVNP